MSRKDFQLIAETLRTLPSFTTINPACSDVVRFDVLVNQFADALRSTNPRFDRERFVSACNGKGGK